MPLTVNVIAAAVFVFLVVFVYIDKKYALPYRTNNDSCRTGPPCWRAIGVRLTNRRSDTTARKERPTLSTRKLRSLNYCIDTRQCYCHRRLAQTGQLSRQH